jgi:hypothetical protein
MSSSGFNVIRRHSSDAASIRIKELTQELAKQRSDAAGSQLETDDVRSQGRMDHSTIKLNDERLKFVTTLSSSNTDFFYEFPSEPDLQYLKVWFMLDHLGARMRDMSGFANDAIIAGHPTLRRVNFDMGFQQTSAGGGVSATPMMLFNSGLDVVSQKNGEYIWIPDNTSIQFTEYPAGFSIVFRFKCLDFNNHLSAEFGTFVRRFAAKTDDALNGWSIVLTPTNAEGTTGAIEFNITHDGVIYKRRRTGFSTSSFYQVVITYDPTLSADNRIKIYVAGVESSIAGISNLSLPTQTNLRIGARDSETGFFYGYLHDFRMYMDKILTQTEITNINANELTIDNITKGHAFVIQYAMVCQVLKSKTHKYNIGGTVTRTRRHKFNITGRITRTRTHKFNMVTGVSRTRTHKFNIVKLVTRTRTHKFSLGGTVVRTRTHKFNIMQKITRTRTHKFNVGGLQAQYQRFIKSTTAGSNISQAITFTSTPQALIVWSDGTTTDNTFTNDVVLNYGFSDGTHHACVTGLSEDGQTTTDTFSGHKSDAVIAFTDENTPSSTPVAEATVSFSSNQAVFNWTTNDTTANYIHCLALWGLNNVEVKTFNNDTTSTGNKIYTLNNTSMTPTFLNTITVNTSGAGWSTGNALTVSIGAAVSSSKQFSVVNTIEDAQAASDAYTAYYTDHVLVGFDDDTGAQEMAAQFVSFGTGNGQFTLNYTDPRSVGTIPFSVLALDSPNVDVGLITQPAATGTQVVNTDTNVNSVAGIMVFSNAQTTTAIQNTAQLMIGGASGTGSTAQGVIVVGENDAASPTETARINRTGKIIKTIAPNNAVASTTTTSEADLSSVSTQDQFTLNWTTANATARKFHYIVFGR